MSDLLFALRSSLLFTTVFFFFFFHFASSFNTPPNKLNICTSMSCHTIININIDIVIIVQHTTPHYTHHHHMDIIDLLIHSPHLTTQHITSHHITCMIVGYPDFCQAKILKKNNRFLLSTKPPSLSGGIFNALIVLYVKYKCLERIEPDFSRKLVATILQS